MLLEMISIVWCVLELCWVSQSRGYVACQWAVKQKKSSKPIVKMTKAEVERDDLSGHVMPTTIKDPFI